MRSAARANQDLSKECQNWLLFDMKKYIVVQMSSMWNPSEPVCW